MSARVSVLAVSVSHQDRVAGAGVRRSEMFQVVSSRDPQRLVRTRPGRPVRQYLERRAPQYPERQVPQYLERQVPQDLERQVPVASAR